MAVSYAAGRGFELPLHHHFNPYRNKICEIQSNENRIEELKTDNEKLREQIENARQIAEKEAKEAKE